MSKGIEMNGRLRGKRGGVVYSVLKGEQVSRAYNDSPTNPRSKSQMSQRVKLGAAVGFYKRTKNFFKFAFKKTQKQSDYNAFIKENINIAPYLRKDEVLNNVIVPAPYRMTRGDLFLNEKLTLSNTETMAAVIASSEYAVTEGMLVSDFMKAINASLGDMITIYVVQSLVDEGMPSEYIDRSWGKYTFKAEDLTRPMANLEYDEYFNGDPDMVVNNKLAFSANITVPDALEDNYACGACIVLSRQVPGSPLMVSSSKLYLNAVAVSAWDNYRSEAKLEIARNSYGSTEEAFLVPDKVYTHA